jgi:hypothetical protein
LNALCAAALRIAKGDPHNAAVLLARETNDRWPWMVRRYGLGSLEGTSSWFQSPDWGQLVADSLLSNQLLFWPSMNVAPGPVCGRIYDAVALSRLRAARLQVALVLFETDKGQPAENLDQLIQQHYLSAMPLDPFSTRPFHYRVSEGESIAWLDAQGSPNAEWREVSPGQGILWAVGPDGVDHGGTKQYMPHSFYEARLWRTSGCDLIYLVPRRPEK